MSTAARKARKRAQREQGVKYRHTPKTRTVAYADRSRPIVWLPWKNPAAQAAQAQYAKKRAAERPVSFRSRLFREGSR